MSRYIMRQMRDEDIGQVTRIDREVFPNDWPPTSYRRELGNRLSHYLVVCEAPAEGEERTNLSGADGLRSETEHSGSSWSRLASGVRQFLGLDAACRGAPGESVVGFAGLWIMLDEAHLSVIAVKENHRRRGLGELLLIAIIQKAMELNARMVTLEARVSNLTAQAIYERFGFRRVGLRRAYYADNREDAVLMTADDITSAPFNARFQRLRRENAEKLARCQAEVVVGL